MADSSLVAARALLDYIHASPTPYHAVLSSEQHLRDAGFELLDESATWSVRAGDRRYVIRNDGSIAAFIVGSRPPAEAGFHIVGAHTDSPNLRLKPHPERKSVGYCQLGVEIYGGVLLATWTDRDLGVAGRVVVDGEDGVETRFVRIDDPIARIPQLAIHLDRDVNDRGLVLNKERHMRPVIGLTDSALGLMSRVAAEIGIENRSDILAFDLMLFPVERPAIAGLNQDFIHAPRLDNLAMCHAGLVALTETADEAVEKTRVVVLYDHEEVGSQTAHGAAGPLLDDLMIRLVGDAAEGFARARAQSFILSADMAHAVHPNYPEKHEDHHLPRMNEGPVIKMNANARYATDAEGTALFTQACRAANVPCQKFVMRADLRCGSTIGPMVATRLGVRTVDVGNPQLSMHSIREMAGVRDHRSMQKAMAQFFRM